MKTVQSMTANVLRTYAAGAAPEQQEQLKKNIREMVGQVFFGTLMKQMRSEMNPDNPFNGGKVGQTFGTQLDQTLISRWASSVRFDVAEKIAREWTGVKETV
jgi:Rod binding domain-containing protein